MPSKFECISSWVTMKIQNIKAVFGKKYIGLNSCIRKISNYKKCMLNKIIDSQNKNKCFIRKIYIRYRIEIKRYTILRQLQDWMNNSLKKSQNLQPQVALISTSDPHKSLSIGIPSWWAIASQTQQTWAADGDSSFPSSSQWMDGSLFSGSGLRTQKSSQPFLLLQPTH